MDWRESMAVRPHSGLEPGRTSLKGAWDQVTVELSGSMGSSHAGAIRINGIESRWSYVALNASNVDAEVGRVGAKACTRFGPSGSR